MGRQAWGIALATLLFATGPAQVALAQLRGESPTIDRLAPRVYLALNYALGNVVFVVTDTSLVVVDTTESPLVAARILEDFRKRLADDGHASDLPISYIIYTHHHGDHMNGARAFWKEGTKVIAQALHTSEMEKYRMIHGYNVRLNTIQWGSALPPERRGILLDLDPRNVVRGYRPPDITFDDEYRFEEGGVKFELYHTEGETIDHLMVWLPELGVLCPGDLYYAAFPMLASPMKPDRPVTRWMESLERMRKLKPSVLAPSHSAAVRGESEIDSRLANYIRAIGIVHDETVTGLNRGETLEAIQRRVKLPADLASLPYLQPIYGRVSWGVAGVYRQYTGWYDMQPEHLNSGPAAERASAIVEAAGGAEPILARGRRAIDDGNAQLALELAELVVAALPESDEAHELAADALEKLADEADNPVEVNVYRSAALEHRSQIAETVGAR